MMGDCTYCGQTRQEVVQAVKEGDVKTAVKKVVNGITYLVTGKKK